MWSIPTTAASGRSRWSSPRRRAASLRAADLRAAGVATVAALSAAGGAACDSTGEPDSRRDAATREDAGELDPALIAFPEGFESLWTEVRDCRNSPEHDNQHIRVFANDVAVDPYLAAPRRADAGGGADADGGADGADAGGAAAAMPVGSILVKPEYADPKCTDLVEYNAMIKMEPGYAPDAHDWRWQHVGPTRRFDRGDAGDGRIPGCVGCHATSSDCVDPPKGNGFDLTCALP